MTHRAKHWARLKNGELVYICTSHLPKVATRVDNKGHLELKRGVQTIGDLSPYSLKTCKECARGKTVARRNAAA